MTGPVKIEFTSLFKRHLKKLNSQFKQKLPNLLVNFSQNPFNSQLKTHKLTGKLSGRFAFSVAPNIRIVFRLADNNQTALLINIGSHDQVYRY